MLTDRRRRRKGSRGYPHATARTSPAVPPLYPAPFVPASDIDLDAPGEVVVDEATHVPDAGVLEDASHLYSMVRDALRVQT